MFHRRLEAVPLPPPVPILRSGTHYDGFPVRESFSQAGVVARNSMQHPPVRDHCPKREHAARRVELTFHRQTSKRHANGLGNARGQHPAFGLRERRLSIGGIVHGVHRSDYGTFHQGLKLTSIQWGELFRTTLTWFVLAICVGKPAWECGFRRVPPVRLGACP